MKRNIAALIAVFMLMGFAAGCSGGSGVGNQLVTVAVSYQPDSLDPQKIATADGAVYTAHLFENLLMATDSKVEKIEVAAAESYTITTEEIDGVEYPVYTFKIRANRWSDGQAVKADDFAFAIERLVDPNTAAPHALDIGRFFYKGLEIASGDAPLEELGVEVIDDNTLKCVMQYPVDLEIFAHASLAPVRRDIADASGEGWASGVDTCVTNGMYKLESWTPGTELVMVKNTNYWNKAYVSNDRLAFKLLANKQELMLLREGEADIALTYPANAAESLRAEGILRQTQKLGTYYVGINAQKAPFDNAKVREAVVKAIDAAYIASDVQMGGNQPAYSLVGPGFKDASGSEILSTDYEARKTEARAALADAGYPGGAGFPDIEYMYGEGSAPVAEALRDMWKDVLNIDVRIVQVDQQKLAADRRAGNYQLAGVEWVAGYNSAAAMLSPFLSGNGGYDSAELDMAIKDARYDEAQAILLEEYAAGPVYFTAGGMLYKDTLRGVRAGALGQVFLEGAAVVE